LLNLPSTKGVLQHVDPAGWRVHRFGLPSHRWESLRDKVFWVTGAGSGYGRCIAMALAAAGAQVFITGRHTVKLEETRTSAGALGIEKERFVVSAGDITNEADMQRIVTALARQSSLYGLVHCAGLPLRDPSGWALSDLDMTQWNALIATNVTGAWLVTRSALPIMASSAMRIVFLTSEAGWAFTPGFGPYNVTKAALNNLCASYAAECAAHYPLKDIQINGLDPGEARTEMNQGSDVSPFAAVCMSLALLSHPSSGPNGCFFHRDGRHLAFARATAYPDSLFDSDVKPRRANPLFRFFRSRA
jgi:NAD(P)-dependent dehydrogenase (short-subunit alcohol dehydrogenase family)